MLFCFSYFFEKFSFFFFIDFFFLGQTRKRNDWNIRSFFLLSFRAGAEQTWHKMDMKGMEKNSKIESNKKIIQMLQRMIGGRGWVRRSEIWLPCFTVLRIHTQFGRFLPPSSSWPHTHTHRLWLLVREKFQITLSRQDWSWQKPTFEEKIEGEK